MALDNQMLSVHIFVLIHNRHTGNGWQELHGILSVKDLFYNFKRYTGIWSA